MTNYCQKRRKKERKKHSHPDTYTPRYTMAGARRMTIPLPISMKLRRYHQKDGMTQKQLVLKFPMYSARSIYRHMKKNIGDNGGDKRFVNNILLI